MKHMWQQSIGEMEYIEGSGNPESALLSDSDHELENSCFVSRGQTSDLKCLEVTDFFSPITQELDTCLYENCEALSIEKVVNLKGEIAEAPAQERNHV
jgi:hypothetical protein